MFSQIVIFSLPLFYVDYSFDTSIHPEEIVFSFMNRFEMTLKEMIEEARMMAETPDLDVVRDSEDDGMLDSEYSSRKSSAGHGQ